MHRVRLKVAAFPFQHRPQYIRRTQERAVPAETPSSRTSLTFLVTFAGRSFHRPLSTDTSNGDTVYTTSFRRTGSFPILPAGRTQSVHVCQ